MKIYVETCQRHDSTLLAVWVGEVFVISAEGLPSSTHSEFVLSREEAQSLYAALQLKLQKVESPR